jgi:hypothetical protein
MGLRAGSGLGLREREAAPGEQAAESADGAPGGRITARL